MRGRLDQMVDSFLTGFANGSGWVLAAFLALLFLHWMGGSK